MKKLSANQAVTEQAAKNYILEYYQQIVEGEATVGHWIREWYKIIVDGLQEKKFYFRQKKANMAIRFIQTFCRHHEGSLAPGRIRLELWQKAMISVIFGITDEEGCRQFREIVIVIGRKNGKTLLAAAINALILYLEPDYGKRVYMVAPKLAQARLCFNALFQMIQKEPELAKITQKRRTDLYIAQSNSSAEPIAFSEKKSDGLNPSAVTCDEVGAWAGEQGLRQYEVMKSALGARKQPMLVVITTAGYVSEGIYDELIKRSTSVINRTSKETRLAPFLYMIDDPEKWNDINEIRKANPNLGVSVTVEYMLEEIAVAEQSLSKTSEFKTKYCNLRQNATTAWLNAEDVNKAFGYRRSLEEFTKCYAVGGADLSQTTDLTSACVLIEEEGILWIHSHFWLPAKRIEEASKRDGVPYQLMIEKGFMSVSGDEFVNSDDVLLWFMDLVKKYKIYPLQIGIDRWSAQELIQKLQLKSFHTDTVTQGFNLSTVGDTFEGMLREGRIRDMDDNGLLKIHMADAAQQLEGNTETAHPRKKLVKISKYAHVDGMAAVLDAMAMRQFKWNELGRRLMNEGKGPQAEAMKRLEKEIADESGR